MGRGVEENVVVWRIASQRAKMIDLSPELVFQVMHDRACRCNRLRHIGATKAVKGFNLEMLAEGETGVLGQKRVAVVLNCGIDLP